MCPVCRTLERPLSGSVLEGDASSIGSRQSGLDVVGAVSEEAEVLP